MRLRKLPDIVGGRESAGPCRAAEHGCFRAMLQRSSGMAEEWEQRFVQAFLVQATIEAIDIVILLELNGIDVKPADLGTVGPFQRGRRRHVGAVIVANHLQLTSPGDQRVELAPYAAASADRVVNDQREGFAREVVYDLQKAKGSAPPHGVGNEGEA